MSALPSAGVAKVPMATSSLFELAGPFGAVGPVRRVNTDGWLPPQVSMFSASTGDPGRTGRVGYGTGRSYGDPERARLLAVIEALERYAGLVVDDRLLTLATASELGSAALDLDRVPRCSERELRRPGCPIRSASKSAPIRWLPGVDLHTGADIQLPAVMVYLQPPSLPGERFWLPISTGCAAHFDVESAVLNALLEVLERDALALTWLQRLPLPKWPSESLTDNAHSLLEWCRRHGITTYLFDATTDLGVPIAYCVQTADHAPRGAQLIGCACSFDAAGAAEHAILETMCVRFGIQRHGPVPRRYADFRSVNDGAAMMASRARRKEFGFLLDDLGPRPTSEPHLPMASETSERLAAVLKGLHSLGMSAYATDISTRETRDAGLVVVRVIIPELQPMSGRPLVQWRAHPRLFEAPARMGYPVRRTRDLNPFPQPMA